MFIDPQMYVKSRNAETVEDKRKRYANLEAKMLRGKAAREEARAIRNKRRAEQIEQQ